jgi:hypothetical protein
LSADIGYSSSNNELIPLREQVFDWLLSEANMKQYKVLDGQMRKCASMEGNALYYLLTLGLADERIEVLVDRLLNWQWPDGGWNCDRHPEAHHSSYMESLIPLRGLALHTQIAGNICRDRRPFSGQLGRHKQAANERVKLLG